jgi:hypothetical protein
MIEAIERINQYIAEQIENFGDLDKYTILQEVVKHQSEEADMWLRMEYMLIDEEQ